MEPPIRTLRAMPSIETDRLVCRFGAVYALDGASIAVRAGSVTALAGPNGAGKTTLLRVLATLHRPDSGAARVAGHDVVGEADRVRRLIGYVGHRSLLYLDLTAIENLRFHCRLHGIETSSGLLREALAGVGLDHRRHDRVRGFSRGTMQRLAIARAVLHQPPVLLLDEPHTGLDPGAADSLDTALAGLARGGHTVLIATHDLDRAWRLADRMAVIDRGRVVWEADTADIGPDELRQRYRDLTEPDAPRSGVYAAARSATSVAGASSATSVAGAPRATSVAAARSATSVAGAPGATSVAGVPTATSVAGVPTATSVAGAPSAASAAGALDPGADESTDAVVGPGTHHRTDAQDAAPDRGRTSFASAVRAILWKDLAVEVRAREIVPPVLVFALLVVVIFQFSLPPVTSVRESAAAGAFWVALLLGSTLGISRSMAAETESGGMTGLLISPIDRGALFAGKWLAAYGFSLLVGLALVPAFAVLLELQIALEHLAVLIAILALSLAGWSSAGVLLGGMAVNTRAREVLLPVLLYPLVLPLVIPAVQATAMALAGAPISELLAPLALIAAYDVVFWVLGFLFLSQVVGE